MKLRCALLDDYQDVALASADWTRLSDRVDVRAFHDYVADRAALVRMLDGYEIIVAMRERTPFDRALLEALPALRLLVTTGHRNAAIDVAAATERGITVCGTRGFPGAAAELAWALILASMRHLPPEVEAFRHGAWQTTIGRSLHGATLGVVGMGKLGTQVATVGRAFGMKVVAWSRSLTPARCGELGIDYAATLPELLRVADVVTLHLALNPQTRGFIGARELALMKPDALLVNTARGPIVEEAALVAALRDRRIAGAALDVFDQEPLSAGHPFRTLDNVVATPHLGYVTQESYAVFYGDAVDDIEAWLAGHPVRVLNASRIANSRLTSP
jgi:phosphoglycerate dehydrogenase-like enzyme